MLRLLCFIMCVLFLNRIIASGMQYSADTIRPFSMSKVNLVWSKAQKRLTKTELIELYSDLKLQDEVEWELKKRKSDGSDEAGEFESKVRKSMLAIMDRYKLYGADGSNYKPPKIMDKNKIPAPVFDPAGDIDGNTDPSLAKLWNKAKRSGFTGPELLDLKQEFVQHQEKIKEYKELYDKLLKVDGISENSVEPSKILDMSFQEIKEKRKSLKQMHHGIKNSLQKLEQITHGQQTKSKLEFNEPRVFDLWIQALKSNMTQIELISFKEELKHFEHKIKKHEYMKEKAKLENINLRTKKNEIPPDFPVDSMSRRAEEYKYKLKKIHADLQYRLEKVKHTEL